MSPFFILLAAACLAIWSSHSFLSSSLTLMETYGFSLTDNANGLRSVAVEIANSASFLLEKLSSRATALYGSPLPWLIGDMIKSALTTLLAGYVFFSYWRGRRARRTATSDGPDRVPEKSPPRPTPPDPLPVHELPATTPPMEPITPPKDDTDPPSSGKESISEPLNERINSNESSVNPKRPRRRRRARGKKRGTTPATAARDDGKKPKERQQQIASSLRPVISIVKPHSDTTAATSAAATTPPAPANQPINITITNAPTVSSTTNTGSHSGANVSGNNNAVSTTASGGGGGGRPSGPNPNKGNGKTGHHGDGQHPKAAADTKQQQKQHQQKQHQQKDSEATPEDNKGKQQLKQQQQQQQKKMGPHADAESKEATAAAAARATPANTLKAPADSTKEKGKTPKPIPSSSASSSAATADTDAPANAKGNIPLSSRRLWVATSKGETSFMKKNIVTDSLLKLATIMHVWKTYAISAPGTNLDCLYYALLRSWYGTSTEEMVSTVSASVKAAAAAIVKHCNGDDVVCQLAFGVDLNAVSELNADYNRGGTFEKGSTVITITSSLVMQGMLGVCAYAVTPTDRAEQPDDDYVYRKALDIGGNAGVAVILLAGNHWYTVADGQYAKLSSSGIEIESAAPLGMFEHTVVPPATLDAVIQGKVKAALTSIARESESRGLPTDTVEQRRNVLVAMQHDNELNEGRGDLTFGCPDSKQTTAAAATTAANTSSAISITSTLPTTPMSLPSEDDDDDGGEWSPARRGGRRGKSATGAPQQQQKPTTAAPLQRQQQKSAAAAPLQQQQQKSAAAAPLQLQQSDTASRYSARLTRAASNATASVGPSAATGMGSTASTADPTAAARM